MQLTELLSKRLIFISGKGGVGKTTVCILLAKLAASQKKKTLLIEMNSSGRIAPLFGADPSDEEIPLGPYISTINLTPKNCFEEYVLMQIRFKTIYEVFFNNKFVTNFINATPGLSEVLLLGKIYDLERQKQSKLSNKPLYDLIIVDMPATGHGLSAMEVPHVIESAVKVGPLHSNAQKMNQLFGNAEKTAFSLVTLAEEMPVTETKEYADALKAKTNVHFGPLFINNIMPEVPSIQTKAKNVPEDLKIYWQYYDLAWHRHELNQNYLSELEKLFPDFNKINLPMQFHELNTVKDFDPLVHQLKTNLKVAKE